MSSDIQSTLITLLGSSGCRQIPFPETLKSLVTKVAKHEFLVKTLGAIHAIFRGIPNEYSGKMLLWTTCCVYFSSSATACDVIKEPPILDLL